MGKKMTIVVIRCAGYLFFLLLSTPAYTLDFSGTWSSEDKSDDYTVIENLVIDQRAERICGYWRFISAGQNHPTYGLLVGHIADNEAIVKLGDDLSFSEYDLSNIPENYVLLTKIRLKLQAGQLLGKNMDSKKYQIKYEKEQTQYLVSDMIWQNCNRYLSK